MDQQKSGVSLVVEELKGAAYLCLVKAAMTSDSDQFPPGSAWMARSQHHERRRRFNAAAEKVKAGVERLLDLGLKPSDLEWAADQSGGARDPECWYRRFHRAEIELLAELEKRDNPERYSQLADLASRLESVGFREALEMLLKNVLPVAGLKQIGIEEAAWVCSNEEEEQDTWQHQLFYALQDL